MKQVVNVYSSSPVSNTQLACVFLSLRRKGVQIVEQPLSALCTPLRRRFLAVTQRLASIGEQLTAHEDRKTLLDAGTENGLRTERDALQSRRRAIQATLNAQEGGQING